jgi:cysteine desulfurase
LYLRHPGAELCSWLRSWRDLAHTSIRFSDRFNTEEVDYVTDKMVTVVTKLRELSPLYEMAKEGVDISKVNWQTA